MSWVTVGSRRLYCFEAGRGRPIVLLHGMALAGIVWAPQVAPLVEAGFRVLVPDIAGHGASGAPDAAMTVTDLVGDLRTVLDAHDVGTVDLVGISMGGTTALALAGMQPDRVRRLVVVNSGPSTDLPDFGRMLSGWVATLRQDNGPIDLLDELWTFSVSTRFSDSHEGRRTYQHWRAINASVDGAGMARVMEGVAGFDGSSLLDSIRARTLFVAGSEDPSVVYVRQLPEKVPGAEYAEIEGAKHIANVDEADAFTRQLMRFLD